MRRIYKALLTCRNIAVRQELAESWRRQIMAACGLGDVNTREEERTQVTKMKDAQNAKDCGYCGSLAVAGGGGEEGPSTQEESAKCVRLWVYLIFKL